MDKTTVSTATREVKVVTHDFYCDDCGKHLGKSTEYGDGYYRLHGEWWQGIHIGDHTLRTTAHRCPECWGAFWDKCKTALLDLGLEEAYE